jgi:hypothetical protein
VQVTTFACGGFVVGFRFSHAVADGLGVTKFMGAVGELAREADQISPPPTWGATPSRTRPARTSAASRSAALFKEQQPEKRRSGFPYPESSSSRGLGE